MPITDVILVNNVLGKRKFILYVLVSILCSIQVCSSWDGVAQQQKKLEKAGEKSRFTDYYSA